MKLASIRIGQRNAIVLSAISLFSGLFWCISIQASDTTRAEEKPSPLLLRVGKDTTYLTEPLDNEGNVDYLAALHSQGSRGVTVDNNATILFIQAGLAREKGQASYRALVDKYLGRDSSRDEGPFFSGSHRLAASAKSELAIVTTTPWAKSEFPLIAAWLDENEVPLVKIVEGIGRPHCYIPLVPSAQSQRIFDTVLPIHQESRDVARCLAARAMSRLADGDLGGARDDLLACHRLGRLVSTVPSMICGLVSCAIERVAGQGDAALLQYVEPHAAMALKYQAQLRQLPPSAPMIERFDTFERIGVLDSIISMYYDCIAAADNEGKNFNVEQIASLKETYEEILRECNKRFDEFAQAGRRPSYQQRIKTLDELHKQASKHAFKILDKNGDRAIDIAVAQMREQLRDQPPVEVGRQVGRGIFALTAPSIKSAIETETRCAMHEELLQIGFALSAYHADHNQFPEQLDQLVPRYIATIPPDRFNDEPLHFSRVQDGYRLYSVGLNLTDDGGRTAKDEPDCDDVALIVLDLKHADVKNSR